MIVDVFHFGPKLVGTVAWTKTESTTAQDSATRIPQLGFRSCLDSATEILQLGNCIDSANGILQLYLG